jgi:hypothetical protein
MRMYSERGHLAQFHRGLKPSYNFAYPLSVKILAKTKKQKDQSPKISRI